MAASERPLVSVYVPTRNRVALLERAIASVLGQNYDAIELVVVDDASEDATPELLRTRAREHARLRHFRNDRPRGACAARNRAIEEARGVFVTGLDDDDEFMPERVAALVAAHQDRFAFVCSRDLVQTRHGRVIQNPASGVITLDQLLHYNRVGNQVLVLRERMRAVAGYDEELPAFQDYDLWVRLVARYGPCLKLADASYLTHAEHDDRISASSERRVQGHARFVAKNAQRFTPAHRASMELLRRKIAGERLGPFDYLRLVNRDNALVATAMLVNSSPPWLVALKDRAASALSARRARR
jgi:glycosyltransferase involved in cell wall biosynthesis